MHPRASSLVESLHLKPHPEGGFYREIFRSSSIVTPKSSDAERTALTSIYYLLPADQVSKFHRVTSDEIWHFLEGDPLELYTLDPSLSKMERCLLGPVSDRSESIMVVPANHWQAAKPTGAFTLTGCTVGPGFEYEDFTLLAGDPALEETIKRRFPQLAELL